MPQTIEQAEAGHRDVGQASSAEARIEDYVTAECVDAVEYAAALASFRRAVERIESGLGFVRGYDKTSILATLDDMAPPDQRAVAEYAEAHAPQGEE